jgi:tetratricopeptide (TPR) repeat protein
VPPLSAVASGPISDPREVGRKLNVDAVLVGTVQRADGRLRVNAQLIRTNTGEQIWADQFEQASAGIFALQDDLSAKIAQALSFELTRAESSRLAYHGTDNVEAYERYLRGRYYEYQNTGDGLVKSIELYEQAAALDPNFADAYAGIADSNTILFNFGIQSANETIPRAKQAINRAMQLNPELPDAYISQALIQFVADRNWPGAKQSLEHAIELNPSDADAYLRYGYFLIMVGNFDEALEKLEKARSIDPLSPIIQTNIGLVYLCSRRYPQAIEHLSKVVANNPSFPLSKWFLATSYDSVGEYDKAFDLKLSATADDGKHELATQLRHVKDNEGLVAANRLWFETDVKDHSSGKGTALMVAQDAAALKDQEQTLYWLEKAVEDEDASLEQIKFIATYDFVRDDERFKSIVEKVNF